MEGKDVTNHVAWLDSSHNMQRATYHKVQTDLELRA